MCVAALSTGSRRQGSPVLGARAVVHAGEGGRGPGAVRLLLHPPLVCVADPDVRDLHTRGCPDPVGEQQGLP